MSQPNIQHPKDTDTMPQHSAQQTPLPPEKKSGMGKVRDLARYFGRRMQRGVQKDLLGYKRNHHLRFFESVLSDRTHPRNDTPPIHELQGHIRLRTLTALRWLAVLGQTLAILVVHFGLGFSVPLGICLGTIAASAWLNLFTLFRFSPQKFLDNREAAFYIAFDICQLCTLLCFTGGLQNPFAVLILAPVTIAASALPLRQTVLLGLLALVGTGLLTVSHLALPWGDDSQFSMPSIYVAGVWTALSFSVFFFAAYAHRIAMEGAQMRSALAATQFVMAREERLSALGGLAAAAAHELGTPLATIQMTAQEMAEEIESGDKIDEAVLRDDAHLLISQSKRCRDILGRLSQRGDAGDIMHDRIRLDALLKEAAHPFLDMPSGPEIVFDIQSDEEAGSFSGPGTPPMLARRPEIIYGLRNFIENATQYARSQVKISTLWDEDQVSITIMDDGAGFSQDVLTRLGEPYLNPRQDIGRKRSKKAGLGLGFFIAKTLLERTGASIQFNNATNDNQLETIAGAYVSTVWPSVALLAGDSGLYSSRELETME